MQFPPIPQAGTIHLQPIRIAAADDADEGMSVLSFSEVERTTKFRAPYDRTRFIVGRVLVRAVIGAATDSAPADVALEIGPRGKPVSTTRIAFSLSHSGRLVILAWALDTPVGVDIEEDAARIGASAAAFRRALHPRERTLVLEMTQDRRDVFMARTWVIKEAIAKATGDGLGLPFCALELDLGQAGAAQTHVRFHDGAASRAGAWHLFEYRIQDAFVAIAAMSEKRPVLFLHEPLAARELVQSATALMARRPRRS